jgi:hypothetical protein
MRRFHVRDAQGRWHTGAWAFVELWTHLPYLRWLAQAVRTLHLVRPLDAVYRPFARWRLSRPAAPKEPEYRQGVRRDDPPSQLQPVRSPRTGTLPSGAALKTLGALGGFHAFFRIQCRWVLSILSP